MKIEYFLMFAEGPLRMAASMLAKRDANNTGIDDELSNAILYLLKRIEDYRANPDAF